MSKYLGREFILKYDLKTRDGLILKGEKCFIDEYDNSSYEPYRVAFVNCKNFYNGLASDWFSLKELKEIMQ